MSGMPSAFDFSGGTPMPDNFQPAYGEHTFSSPQQQNAAGFGAPKAINTGMPTSGIGSPTDMIANATPYGGGPQSMMPQTGFQTGANQNPNQYLTMSGFQQGGMGPAPQTANNQYQAMLADPTSMTANPAYKAIMDASLQATQRAGLAQGQNGGGTLQAELAKTGASVAGQYLPQMAQMYQGGAQQETNNFATQNQQNQQAGQLGNSIYGTANQANLGYGNLANNMYANAAGNQFNRGVAYTNAQEYNAQTGTAQQALQQQQQIANQMNPGSQYFQNQLTMSGMPPTGLG